MGEAIADLHELANGRADLLAETAGLMAATGQRPQKLRPAITWWRSGCSSWPAPITTGSPSGSEWDGGGNVAAAAELPGQHGGRMPLWISLTSYAHESMKTTR